MKKALFAVLLALLMLISACERKVEPDSILAEVNGEILDRETFIASFGVTYWDSLNQEAKRSYVEDWVNLTLLAQAAEKAKLDQEPMIRQRIDFAGKKVKANALISKRLAEIKISEDQLFSYFRIHQADFVKDLVNYQIQRIALPDKASALRVMQEINQGGDFEVALRRYSSEALRSTKGMMGFVEEASPDSVFWHAAHQLKLMEPGIVSRDGDWYVIRYTQTAPSDKLPNFEDYRAEIKARILAEKQEELYHQLLREIKAQNQEIYYY